MFNYYQLAFQIVFTLIVFGLFIISNILHPTFAIGKSGINDFFICAVAINLILFIAFRNAIYKWASCSLDHPLPIKDRYKRWFAPIVFFSYFFFAVIALTIMINLFNQYRVSSSTESVMTSIITKNHHDASRDTGYVYYNLFDKTYSITLANDIYDRLELSDTLILKIRKGRFGKYFLLEIGIPKLNISYQF